MQYLTKSNSIKRQETLCETHVLEVFIWKMISI